jgi:hypothetical protein
VGDTCHNPQSDQDQDAYSDPLRRNMRQMRSHSQASDKYDETNDVQCKRHTSSHGATSFPAPGELSVQMEGQCVSGCYN